MRRKRMSSHLRRKKPNKVTRKYAQKLLLDPTAVPRMSRLLPYG
jgi:ribosomal protein L35